MMADIGLIVAVYTLPRLVAMLGQPISETNNTAKFMSFIAILVTVGALFDLLSHGLQRI